MTNDHHPLALIQDWYFYKHLRSQGNVEQIKLLSRTLVGIFIHPTLRIGVNLRGVGFGNFGNENDSWRDGIIV